MPGTSIFAASQISLVAPFPLVDGLVEDGFFKISPVGDMSDTEPGADGHVTMIMLNDPRWEVEISLMYGSSHNEQYSALFAVHQNNGRGAAIGGLLCKDNNGATLYAMSKLIPRTHAGTEMGKSGKARVWKFWAIGNAGGAISGGNAA